MDYDCSDTSTNFKLKKGEYPDFLIAINFPPNTEYPQRIFSIASEYIESLQSCDKMLLKSIQSNLKPIFVLEQVNTGSLKIWLKQFLEGIPDDAIRTGNWKITIGQYLVKGKYLLLKKLSDANGLPSKSGLEEISNELHKIAKETEVLKLPAYTKIPEIEIAKEAENIGNSLAKLNKGESIIYECDEGNANIKAGFQITQEEIDNLLINQKIENIFDRILMIRKPDFLGDSQWVFSFERRNLSISIDDKDWLARFQAGEVDIRPGDALKVRMKEVDAYDATGEVIKVERTIVEVIEVIRKQIQGNLFD